MIELRLCSSITNPPRGDDIDRSVQETLAEATLAENWGFHDFFCEHYQDQDGFLPSSFVLCGARTARTKKV
jgi:hypothetical protein